MSSQTKRKIGKILVGFAFSPSSKVLIFRNPGSQHWYIQKYHTQILENLHENWLCKHFQTAVLLQQSIQAIPSSVTISRKSLDLSFFCPEMLHAKHTPGCLFLAGAFPRLKSPVAAPTEPLGGSFWFSVELSISVLWDSELLKKLDFSLSPSLILLLQLNPCANLKQSLHAAVNCCPAHDTFHIHLQVIAGLGSQPYLHLRHWCFPSFLSSEKKPKGRVSKIMSIVCFSPLRSPGEHYWDS